MSRSDRHIFSKLKEIIFSASGTAAASHGVMSPSLTSGFSGSGDCKSTETCSLLSVASYSSATPTTAHHNKERQGAESGGSSGTTGTRHTVNCEVCHLPFPSRAVLEHHLMGSRHARKVKAQSVLRQLQVGPPYFIYSLFHLMTNMKIFT